MQEDIEYQVRTKLKILNMTQALEELKHYKEHYDHEVDILGFR